MAARRSCQRESRWVNLSLSQPQNMAPKEPHYCRSNYRQQLRRHYDDMSCMFQVLYLTFHTLSQNMIRT